MRLEQYLAVLAHKPRAVTHAGHRELVAILRLAETVGVGGLAVAIETALRYRAFDLESVRSVLAMAVSEDPSPMSGRRHLDRWPKTPVTQVAAGAYAWLDEVAVALPGPGCRTRLP